MPRSARAPARLRALFLGATALASLAALGCKPHYDGVQIRFLLGEGRHAHDRLEIVEGQAVVIEVQPVSKNPYEDYEAFDLVELTSFNENTLFVAPAPEYDQFVLGGAGLGETVLRVRINGEQVDTLDAAVVERIIR
jgi:hypothetical protein